jgi:hypothetical protein
MVRAGDRFYCKGHIGADTSGYYVVETVLNESMARVRKEASGQCTIIPIALLQMWQRC